MALVEGRHVRHHAGRHFGQSPPPECLVMDGRSQFDQILHPVSDEQVFEQVEFAVRRFFNLDETPAVLPGQHRPSPELVHLLSAHYGERRQILPGKCNFLKLSLNDFKGVNYSVGLIQFDVLDVFVFGQWIRFDLVLGKIPLDTLFEFFPFLIESKLSIEAIKL